MFNVHFVFALLLDLSEPIDVYSEWIDAINERDTKKSLKKKIPE